MLSSAIEQKSTSVPADGSRNILPSQIPLRYLPPASYMQSDFKNIKLFIRIIMTFVIAGMISCNSDQNGLGSNSTSAANSADSAKVKKLAANYIRGKHLFERLCNTCHVAPERKVTDQYFFDNLFERLPSPPEDYFIKYIQDSRSLRSSGDNYAIKQHDAWDVNYDHYFKDSLSRDDFYDLIVYIKVAAKQKYQ